MTALNYEFFDKTRLTDARRPADQNQPARTRSRSREPLPEERQFLAAPNELITRDGHLRSIAGPRAPSKFSTRMRVTTDAIGAWIGECSRMDPATTVGHQQAHVANKNHSL